MALRAEEVVRFGPGQRLLGIVNLCPGDAAVACLLLNVGVTQRIGPRRLNVKLARALGAAGIPSMRFDLSGIGDSAAAGASGDYRSQAVADLRSAMDHLEQEHGIHRFVILGLCSGAVNGFRAAQADPRVTGLLMFDGFAFPTLATQLLHDWRRMRTTPPRQRAAKALQRLMRMFGLGSTGEPVSIFYATRDSNTPDRRAYADAMTTLAARGVRLLVAYSGSMLAHYNHESQFRRAFAGEPFLAEVEDRYLPNVDHVATSQAAQAELLGLVTRWVGSVVARKPSLVFDDANRRAVSA